MPLIHMMQQVPGEQRRTNLKTSKDELKVPKEVQQFKVVVLFYFFTLIYVFCSPLFI